MSHEFELPKDTRRLVQGRRTIIPPFSKADVLWIERADMPTEFIGGLLIIDSGGVRAFEVHARWGVGSVEFEDCWLSSEDDGPHSHRFIGLIPACDAFFCTVLNPYSTEIAVNAVLSRDVRVFDGVQLPFHDPCPFILAGGIEPMYIGDEGSGALAIPNSNANEPMMILDEGLGTVGP